MRKVFMPCLLLLSSCFPEGQRKINAPFIIETPEPTAGSCYYSPKNFLEKKILFYVNEKNPKEKERWVLKTEVSGADTFLMTEIYNIHNKLTERFREKIKNGNSLLVSYAMFSDTTELTKGNQVFDSLVYKTAQKKYETISWRISLPALSAFSKCEMIKDRSLKKIDSNQVVFSDKIITRGYITGDFSTTTISVFQKGKGLISYKYAGENSPGTNFVLEEKKRKK